MCYKKEEKMDKEKINSFLEEKREKLASAPPLSFLYSRSVL
jgi:hypothetical protein